MVLEHEASKEKEVGHGSNELYASCGLVSPPHFVATTCTSPSLHSFLLFPS